VDQRRRVELLRLPDRLLTRFACRVNQRRLWPARRDHHEIAQPFEQRLEHLVDGHSLREKPIRRLERAAGLRISQRVDQVRDQPPIGEPQQPLQQFKRERLPLVRRRHHPIKQRQPVAHRPVRQPRQCVQQITLRFHPFAHRDSGQMSADLRRRNILEVEALAA